MDKENNYMEQIYDDHYIMKLFKPGMGIKKCLDIACEILGNPIYMIDVGYNLLASTDHMVSDDPLWGELTTRGAHSHDMVHFFKMEGFFATAECARVAALLKSAKLKYNRIVGKLFDEDAILIGDIVVVECHKPFEAKDYDMIESICRFISKELQESDCFHKISRLFQATVVSNLIDHNSTNIIYNFATFKNELSELHMTLKANLYVAAVEILFYDQTLSHLAYFRNLFESLQKEYKYYVYLNTIVIIISIDDTLLSIERDLGNLNEFFREYGICAGISSCFTNINELKKYYKQAISALNKGIGENNGQSFYKYDDFLMDNVLDVIRKSKDIAYLCHPVVELIKKYDQENQKDYLEILYCYLLNGRNLNLTASRMMVDQDKLHRSIGKIGDIFGVDWNNGNMLTSILISIKMLKAKD